MIGRKVRVLLDSEGLTAIGIHKRFHEDIFKKRGVVIRFFERAPQEVDFNGVVASYHDGGILEVDFDGDTWLFSRNEVELL